MLNHVRKLVLIPLEEWEKIKDKNMKEMKQVVVSLPAQEKVNTSPMSPTVKKSQSGRGNIYQTQKVMMKNNSAVNQMFKDLSPAKKHRASSLLRYIRKSKKIDWNSKLELKINGKILPKTNITYLINHAIHQQQKFKPKGIKIFYRALAQLNIPKFIIVNKEGYNIMKKVRNEKNLIWRPPGKLDKN